MAKIAHLFAWPDLDAKEHRVELNTPTVSIIIVGNKDVDQAANTAKKLVKEEGVQLIELCGAFGPDGNAKIIEAVGGKVPVASVSYGLDIAAKALELFKE
jgi:hypothetical protein